MVNGTLNSTQVNALADQPVLMFKVFAIILILAFVIGALYAAYQMWGK